MVFVAKLDYLCGPLPQIARQSKLVGNRLEICKHNKEVALEINRPDIANYWNIIEKLAVPSKASTEGLLYVTLKRILAHLTLIRDFQTFSTLYCVFFVILIFVLIDCFLVG